MIPHGRQLVTLGCGAAIAALLLAACGSGASAPATSRVVNVVAAENLWGNITSQIGGSHVSVTSIISNPSADPHLYTSSAQNAAAVGAARVVVVNGVGYDDFMSRLLAATSGPHRVVVTVAHVLGVSGSDPNPHLWYDVPRMPLVAKAIERQLAAADPADANTFRSRLARFDRSLEPVLATIATIRADYPGAPVAYTERVPGYLLAEAGLRVVTPVGFATAIEQGTDPSPADTEAMYQLFTQHRTRVLLYNSQTVSSVTMHVRSLATEAGIPIVAVSESLPPRFATYQAWQLSQGQALLAALRSGH